MLVKTVKGYLNFEISKSNYNIYIIYNNLEICDLSTRFVDVTIAPQQKRCNNIQDFQESKKMICKLYLISKYNFIYLSISVLDSG